MKKVFLKFLIFLSMVFFANIAIAQDIITLKNGDEIKSKVMEVSLDLVKYKKWDNMEGPAYSAKKSEIFMIKYSNGTKDVFKTEEIQKSNEDAGTKLKQENVEQTIKEFIRQNINKMRVPNAFLSTYKVDPISQFSENEASSIVHFNYQDSYTNELLKIKFTFKRNINNKWFLTSLSAIAGIGSQGLADDIRGFLDINFPVNDYHNTQISNVGQSKTSSTTDNSIQTNKIGEKFGGGIIFYVDNTGQHGLIASLNDQSSAASWDNGENIKLDANSKGDGLYNTSIITRNLGQRGYYAAKFCREYDGGGFKDWYLPSKDELVLLYSQKATVGNLFGKYYWSSSETSNIHAWNIYFANGTLYDTQKIFKCNVRAIREF